MNAEKQRRFRAVRHAYWAALFHMWNAAERVTARMSRLCWLRKIRAAEAMIDSASAAQIEARIRAINERFDALQQMGGE